MSGESSKVHKKYRLPESSEKQINQRIDSQVLKKKSSR